ncbi:MAG: rhomboid family intramembrane serine protease [Alphaproteobacteria bacterium]|nr:rhomboid family intramembrane serine protease [Alphaproteobacteria bacterium]
MHDPFSWPGRRSPRGPFPGGGPASRQPVFNVPPVTLGAVAAIVAVYLLLQLLLPGIERLVIALSVVPARIVQTLADPGAGAVLRDTASLVTHALIHTELLHMAVNAGFLLAFGSFCERALERTHYIWLLLGSAVGGALVQVAMDWGAILVMFGASGAVSGCMGGMVRVQLRPGSDPHRRRFALTFVAVLFVLNLVLGMLGSGLMGGEAQIAWEAHIGGFLAGFLIAGRGDRSSSRQPS